MSLTPTDVAVLWKAVQELQDNVSRLIPQCKCCHHALRWHDPAFFQSIRLANCETCTASHFGAGSVISEGEGR